MTPAETIRNNWSMDIYGQCKIIPDTNPDAPAWSLSTPDNIGVVIPYCGDQVNEHFSDVHLFSDTLFLAGSMTRVLRLTAAKRSNSVPFSSLCADFVSPERRTVVLTTPVLWWQEWKQLLGNRNVDDRVYDVLGELCALKLLACQGIKAVWNGPNGASWDIESSDTFYEVKSTVVRSKLHVTISSEFQLAPPEKPLMLMYFVFEKSAMTGICIDSVVADLETLGFDIDDLNSKLQSLGLEMGMSARQAYYQLEKALLFTVDDSFPAIKPSSFVGGEKPSGVISYTYTISLENLPHTVLL